MCVMLTRPKVLITAANIVVKSGALVKVSPSLVSITVVASGILNIESGATLDVSGTSTDTQGTTGWQLANGTVTLSPGAAGNIACSPGGSHGGRGGDASSSAPTRRYRFPAGVDVKRPTTLGQRGSDAYNACSSSPAGGLGGGRIHVIASGPVSVIGQPELAATEMAAVPSTVSGTPSAAVAVAVNFTE